jgi:hypothetical protein
MAVNCLDGPLFAMSLMYPVAACVASAKAGAGWLSILLIPPAWAVGIGMAFFGRSIVYATTGPLMAYLDRQTGWTRTLLDSLLAIPILMMYLVFPYAISMMGIVATGFACHWLICHVV